VKTIFCIIAGVLLSCVTLMAQKVYHHQVLYWLRYQHQLIFSPTVYWNNEIDNRRFIGPDVQSQFIMHSRLHFRTGRWDLAGGLSWALAYAAFPEQGARAPLAELRPVIEATHELPFRKLFFQNRIRLDNRFFQEDYETNVFEDSDYLLRMRYRFQVRFPIKKNEHNVTAIGMRIADEIMLNSEKNFYDQNRIYITTDLLVTRKLSLEAGYLYIDQQRRGREDFFSRNVLRFSILHKTFLR
jgi:hypothetical protein